MLIVWDKVAKLHRKLESIGANKWILLAMSVHLNRYLPTKSSGKIKSGIVDKPFFMI